MHLAVFVESWQIECCWEPPVVGDLLPWHLVFVDEAESAAPAERGRLHLDVTGYPVGGPGVRPNIRLEGPGISLHWSAPREVSGRLRLTGHVHEDHHGGAPESLPATPGLIRRIRIEERTYAATPPGSGSWHPAAGPPRYLDVATSPKWFRDPTPPGRDQRTVRTGILVDIETRDELPGR